MTNAVDLARDLIRAPSVTPDDGTAMDVLAAALEKLGFACTRYPFGEVDNLYARLGTEGPVLAFAGHTDVVPTGDEASWTRAPFSGDLKDGILWGRGAADMKGAIAAFAAAVGQYKAEQGDPPGSIAFLITGDEEGPALDGTVRLMEAVHAAGERFDQVLVGEPTNPNHLGETIKIGRRGSLNGVITVTGRQGHVAYPELAANPVPVLLQLLDRLLTRELDTGAPHFQPSNLEVTSVDVGNTAHNVIPGKATAQFNIRFNTAHKGDDLKRWIEDEAKAVGLGYAGKIDLNLAVTGEAFLSKPGGFVTLLQDAAEAETGRRPALTTGGGTSDARFIRNYAPVCEFGLVGATMHQIDERVPAADIDTLTRIYARVIAGFFAGTGK
ncbi:succinyl-diaminopimelate desuccinylase [Hyphobacterium marinum]|uniref:Succinyl-diaminopimelate desuccinylase n=1 Tax=Hyphobacterium marinum TaxID=3116574 RepID=A0ABU7LW96_9PROT|nr:succinyl-diaminopimelate desuccinylase [Hyphobacterium sp. Y6023]MEE2565828.1 succinyl-diaminopimelate desuccinylase [Hyphobacterium sp. Y6023]